MKLNKVLSYCFLIEVQPGGNFLDKDIKTITQDTRQVVQDSLFIAIEGAKFDGHEMIQQALEQGAVAVVVEKRPSDQSIPYILVPDTKKALAEIANAFYQTPSEKLKVVGVTGTNGKTTITHLVDQIANQLGDKAGIIGTMYNKIDTKILPTINTTPDSITIQQLFQQMNQAGVKVSALEVSSHGLAQGRTWGIDFDVAVFTNLTQDHLDFHGTMDEYFLAKSLLFSQLGNSFTGKHKLAVINWDDNYGRRMCELTSMNVLSYGCRGEGDLQACDIRIKTTGTSFTLSFHNQTYKVQTNLIGEFNVYNLLAAIGVSIGLGYNFAKVIESIPLIQPVMGRFQLVPNLKKVAAIVDYAHTPDGLENVLKTAQEIATKKIYCVVGCGGDRDKAKRPMMAEIALTYATSAIFTTDNPRTEDPLSIVEDMITGNQKDNYLIELDRKKAIQLAMDLAEEGDIVLVAGKGHETYQIIGEETSDFDDSEIINHYQPGIKATCQ